MAKATVKDKGLAQRVGRLEQEIRELRSTAPPRPEDQLVRQAMQGVEFDQLMDGQDRRDAAELARTIERSEEHRFAQWLEGVAEIEKGAEGVRVIFKDGNKKFVKGPEGFELWRRWMEDRDETQQS